MDDCGSSPGLHVHVNGMTRFVPRIMITLVGMLALWGVAPALAGARSWHLNGAPITGSVATGWKGTLKFNDTPEPVGPVAVECEDTAEGSVGPGGVGEVTKWSASKCAILKGCEAAGGASVEPVHLPWRSELVVVGGSLRNNLVSSGKGTPGYKLKCRVLGGIHMTEECTGTLSTAVTNNSSGVTAAFSPSEKLNCEIGGKETGWLEGSQSIQASGGGKLSAETEVQPLWLINGSPVTGSSAIKWKGTITLSDTLSFGKVAVTCEDTGSGSATAASAGEQTSWTISKCTPAAHCESAASIEAVHLPWHTELFVDEGTLGNMPMTGSGIPGFKLKCKALGETIADECAVPASTVTNTKSGVSSVFYSTKFSCADGLGGGGQLEGTQAVETVPGLLQVS